MGAIQSGQAAAISHLSDEEVIHNAMKREYCQFPVKPVACAQSVFKVMGICWAMDMRQRAIFQKLNRMLQQITSLSFVYA